MHDSNISDWACIKLANQSGHVYLKFDIEG